MKKVNVVVSLLFVGLVTSAVSAQENLTLKKGQAGIMVVGKSVYDGLTPDDDVRVGEKENVTEIFMGGKRVMVLEVKVETFIALDYVVKTITVSDKRFRTELGIGVGSTLAGIRAKYADAQLEKTADGRQVATVGELSMYFWVEQVKSPSRSLLVLGRDTDSTEYSDQDLKVTSVTVF